MQKIFHEKNGYEFTRFWPQKNSKSSDFYANSQVGSQ